MNKREKERKVIKELIHTKCLEAIGNPDISKYLDEIRSYNKELYSHSINVAVLSVVIGINVLDREKDIKDLFTSALLHDYGKLYVSKRILNKKDTLTRNERCEMEKHPLYGYRRLNQDNKLSNDILMGILDHHERIDGSGYGNGKCEDEISKFAKIIMIADVYDAMISDRVYRKKLGRGIAYEYLFKKAGTDFCRPEIRCFINTTISLDLDYVISEFTKNIFENSIEKLVTNR